MAKKTKNELLMELPELIKKSGDFQLDKTVGNNGLYDIILDIIDSLMIEGARVPIGGIINWSGTINNIPLHWSLCDGNKNTPNLRDRFILGSGNVYSPNTRGGSSNHTHAGTVGGHSLTVEEIPPHSHGIRNYTQLNSNAGSGGEAAGYFEDKQTTTTGIGKSHVHPFSGVNSQTILPPYYSLAYIMYQGLDWISGVVIYIHSIDNNKNLSFTVSGGTIVNGLNLQYSTDGLNWTSSAGDSNSPKNVASFNPVNGSFFRLQSLDDITNYSNDIQYLTPDYSSDYSSDYSH